MGEVIGEEPLSPDAVCYIRGSHWLCVCATTPNQRVSEEVGHLSTRDTPMSALPTTFSTFSTSCFYYLSFFFFFGYVVVSLLISVVFRFFLLQ